MTLPENRRSPENRPFCGKPGARRSVLFMPASNQRAVAKAARLAVDTIILDLEDSVLPAQKAGARESLAQMFSTHDFGAREVLVRINGLDSHVWLDDLKAVMGTPAHGIVVPKIESPKEVGTVVDTMRAIAREREQTDKPLWIMLETPIGILSAQSICGADEAVTAVLIGTADLGKELRIPERPDRCGLIASLSQVVLAARAAGISAIDGVFMDIGDREGLRSECEQGAALGFDGKSLIHPAQLDAANQVFAPSAGDLENARQMLQAWEESVARGAGVCVVNNRLVEHLHVKRAQELIELADKIEKRGL